MAGNQLLLSTSRLQIADVMVHYRKVDRDFQIICIVFPSKPQCICHNCTTADEEITNIVDVTVHYQEIDSVENDSE